MHLSSIKKDTPIKAVARKTVSVPAVMSCGTVLAYKEFYILTIVHQISIW